MNKDEAIGGLILIAAICGAGFTGGWFWRGDHSAQLAAAKEEGAKEAELVYERELLRHRNTAVSAGHAEWYLWTPDSERKPVALFRWLEKSPFGELNEAGFVKAEPALNACIQCHATGSIHQSARPRRTLRESRSVLGLWSDTADREQPPPPPEPAE